MKLSPFSGVEHLQLSVFKEYVEASNWVAEKIAHLIRSQKSVTLGLCAGASPSKIYAELIRLHREENLSFSTVTVFLLDEYYPLASNAVQSKRAELDDKLFRYVDIPTSQIHSLDGSCEDYLAECARYEQQIIESGGLDLLLVGIGGTGHIGANEPGTHTASRTRRVPLDRITKISAAGNFKGEEYVPSSALTMGIGTIMEAGEIVVLAFGSEKSTQVKRLVEGEVTTSFPASILQEHPNCAAILDEESAEELIRISAPWTKDICDWSDDRLVRKAVIWLARHTDKSILKLTNRDYADNGMGDLLNLYGNAYSINIDQFNKIERIITGWPGGKPECDDRDRPERSTPAKKRVIVFSPHPDDDVISMGGTLARLVDHGHEVHVSYQTNGNLAVADSLIQELLDQIREVQSDPQFGITLDSTILEEIEKSLSSKEPLTVDSTRVQKLKSIIRKVETISACRHIGIPLERNHHLNLPFYHTGEVRKKPLSQEDIDIVKAHLQEIQPHQIFAAGDLSDPHGTHRICLNALFEALDQLAGEQWLENCRVWLYRGAWAEWPIAQADMAVPISPEELMRKRIAIFKHSSQKDGIVFPGADHREFWQRAEDRNRGTAEKFDQLGFAEYEAIELFVRYR